MSRKSTRLATQTCPRCGYKRKLLLSERVYVCETCGYCEDRDVKSAICIEKEGLRNLMSSEAANKYNKVPMDSREVKLQDIRTSAINFRNMLSHIFGIKSKLVWLSGETPFL